MIRKAALFAASMLSALPALAAVQSPTTPPDKRLRVVAYDPSVPVTLPVVPGATVRLQLGSEEHVEQVLASDQGGMDPEPTEPPPPGVTAASATQGGAQASPPARGDKWPPSCDVNLCRTVVGNFIYLRPLRALEPQPLFVQTKRCTDAAGTPANCDAICPPESNIPTAGGKCEMIPYSFEILTRPADIRAASETVAWSVSFTYADRDKAASRLAAQKRYAERLAAWHDRQANKVPPPPVSKVSDNPAYGYQGSKEVEPDDTWDDGRTTFMRFKGNRRIPIVERILPGNTPSIAAYSPETDTTGTTIRIARTEKTWKLRDGDEVGCVFNVGPDPNGRNSTTVATGGPR